MKMGQNQSLWTSVILHFVLLIALFVATLVEAFLPKDSSHVFELVSDTIQPDAVQGARPIEPPLNFAMPNLQPMNSADSARIEPAPVTTSKPQPVQAEEMRMSYEEFIKKNPIKSPALIKPRSSLPTPVIDASRYSRNLQHNLPTAVDDSAADLMAADRSALQRYGNQLNRRLNQAWIKPANLSGIKLVVNVVFDVGSSGQVENIRLDPASGNAAFDASVKAAFAKVASGGVTPTGQAHRFTMSFRMD